MNTPLKILVISNYRDGNAARPEAEIFISLAGMGCSITIMTFTDCDYVKKFEKAGIRVIDFHPVKKYDRQAIRTIRDELIRGDYQFMHLFNSYAIINGLIAARKLPVKVILYRGYTGKVWWYDPTSYFKYLSPRVDKIICNSKGVEEHLQRQLFFDKSKTVTINKGHDLIWYKDIKAIDLSEFGIPDGAFIVSCVANNRKMKGVKYLLKATALIPENLPVHFLIIGRGMEKKEFQKLRNKSPNGDKIHFTGYRNDALRLVKSSDTFVLSSLRGESITKSVLEAMSLGITPIITDIPGNRELVETGINGIVVPSANPEAIAEAILKLHQNADLKVKMGENSKERVNTILSHKQTISAYIKFYQENSDEKKVN